MSSARPSVARRIARVVGFASVTLGVLALGWAVVVWMWGDPITGLYTRWEQRELRSELARVEERYAPPTAHDEASLPRAQPDPLDPVETGRDARRLRAETEPGAPLGRIRVKRLALDMVVVAGTDSRSLQRGPGVDARGHLPGQGQLVYIAGHRTTFGAPFARIDRLRTGDRIELDMPYGTFGYRVTSHVIVPADDMDRLRSRGREEIALQACHPRFSAKQRYIVYARPVGPATA